MTLTNQYAHLIVMFSTYNETIRFSTTVLTVDRLEKLVAEYVVSLNKTDFGHVKLER